MVSHANDYTSNFDDNLSWISVKKKKKENSLKEVFVWNCQAIQGIVLESIKVLVTKTNKC